MGRTKGDVVVEGATLAERAARALWPLCGSVLISVSPAARNPAPGFPTIEDEPPPGRGPLAGIAAGFRATGGADLLVLACDYPNVALDLLAALVAAAEDHDVAIPTDPGGRDHPLVGLWRRSAEGPVRRVLEAMANYPDREELKREYPELEDEDIRQALEYAATRLEDKMVALPQSR